MRLIIFETSVSVCVADFQPSNIVDKSGNLRFELYQLTRNGKNNFFVIKKIKTNNE